MSARTTTPAALVVEPGRLPDELPQSLGVVEPPLAWAEPVAEGGGRPPLTLFLTVDVEDTYFSRPVLMTGEGLGREYGVFGILDQLDVHGFKATFFVNVYERDRQPKGVVEEVVREIADRGHEVGLHTHPSPGSELYGRPLFHLPEAQQAEILRSGVESIVRWTGAPPVSFRAGGYALDDRTLAAIEQVGIAIDSSCFFPSANNRQKRLTVNAVTGNRSVIEVPITTVLQIDGDSVKHSKLDFNWLSVDQLLGAVDSASVCGASFATFMMHSFSFIGKATRREQQPSSPDAILTSGEAFGCYVDVFGPQPRMRISFAAFLDRVAAAPRLRVRTLVEALPELRAVASAGGTDLVPVVGG